MLKVVEVDTPANKTVGHLKEGMCSEHSLMQPEAFRFTLQGGGDGIP